MIEMRKLCSIVTLFMVLSAVFCGAPFVYASPSESTKQTELIVFAAVSMTETLEKIAGMKSLLIQKRLSL